MQVFELQQGRIFASYYENDNGLGAIRSEPVFFDARMIRLKFVANGDFKGRVSK